MDVGYITPRKREEKREFCVVKVLLIDPVLDPRSPPRNRTQLFRFWLHFGGILFHVIARAEGRKKK